MRGYSVLIWFYFLEFMLIHNNLRVFSSILFPNIFILWIMSIESTTDFPSGLDFQQLWILRLLHASIQLSSNVKWGNFSFEIFVCFWLSFVSFCLFMIFVQLWHFISGPQILKLYVSDSQPVPFRLRIVYKIF